MSYSHTIKGCPIPIAKKEASELRLLRKEIASQANPVPGVHHNGFRRQRWRRRVTSEFHLEECLDVRWQRRESLFCIGCRFIDIRSKLAKVMPQTMKLVFQFLLCSLQMLDSNFQLSVELGQGRLGRLQKLLFPQYLRLLVSPVLKRPWESFVSSARLLSCCCDNWAISFFSSSTMFCDLVSEGALSLVAFWLLSST